MNVMFNFICMGFAELWATGSKPKIQNKNIWIHLESNQRLLAFQHAVLIIWLRWQFYDLLLQILTLPLTINQHVWQWKHEIDYGLVCSYKGNGYQLYWLKNAEFVWQSVQIHI